MTGRVVKRAYRYRFYPTAEQAAELNRTLGCVRLVYNRALEVRASAWESEKRRVTYADTSAMLPLWKRDPDLAFLRSVSSVPLQQCLRHLQAAFEAFWGKRSRHPRFKSRKHSRQAAEYTRAAFKWRGGRLTLAKMSAPLAIRWSRPLPEEAEPSTVTVSRDAAGRWHVSLLCEVSVSAGPETTAAVGIDAGITSLVTLSTGETVPNLRHERHAHRQLVVAQRRLARKQKGSNNRFKARRKVARIHARIADRRRDHLHKLTTRLVRENQTIVIEDLSVRNMLRNHALARSISDVAWGDLRAMLEYKCGWYDRDLVVLDRFFPSSKVCSDCGALQHKMPLNVRAWDCRCGAHHDRDVNAAINIRAAGLAVLACGDGVRPARAQALVGSRR